MKLLMKYIDATFKGLLVAGVLVLPLNSPVQAQDFGELSGAKTAKKQRVELDFNSPKFSTSGSVVGAQKSATQVNRGQQVQATVHQFHQMKFRNPGEGWTAWPKSGINFDAYNHPKAAARPIVQAPKEQPKAPATHCFERQNDLWAYQDAVTNSQQSTTSGHATETDAYGSVIKK
jgi:hypothetical protein